MSVAELQLQLHQVIDTITDSKKVRSSFHLVAKGPYEHMSLEEYVEARQQVREGKYMGADELEKENW